MPDFNLQPTVPIAGIADMLARKNQLESEMQLRQQQQLNQGLQSIGQVGQTLLDRRRSMAQALAGAQLYLGSDEGKKMAGLNQVASGPNGQPVTMGQTAQGDVGGATPTPNKPAVDLNTMAMAFMGDKPSDIMSQMFERHKLTVETGLEAERIRNENVIQKLLAGIKGQEAGTQATHVAQEDINTLLQRRQEASANLSTGFFNSINNDKDKQARFAIADIDRQLMAKGYKGVLPPIGGNQGINSQQLTTPKFGATYTVNTSG